MQPAIYYDIVKAKDELTTGEMNILISVMYLNVVFFIFMLGMAGYNTWAFLIK